MFFLLPLIPITRFLKAPIDNIEHESSSLSNEDEIKFVTA
jgi:hypothetical protein